MVNRKRVTQPDEAILRERWNMHAGKQKPHVFIALLREYCGVYSTQKKIIFLVFISVSLLLQQSNCVNLTLFASVLCI